MKKHIYLYAALALFTSSELLAQTGFATLPARDKTRLAQEEELASEQDGNFQSLMMKGMDYFESDRFEEALSSFEEAGNARPLNVYPPVMIEDVKLAMEMYIEPEKKEEPKKEEPKKTDPADNMTADERVAIMYAKEMAKVNKGTPPKPKEKDPVKEALKNEVKRDAEGLIIFESEQKKEAEKAVKEETKPALVQEHVSPKESSKPTETVKKNSPKTEKELQAELGAAYPDGITEKILMEGKKEVTQRIVVKNRSGNDYRRVKHPWGGVFYFKNNTSVTQRVWDEETVK